MLRHHWQEHQLCIFCCGEKVLASRCVVALCAFGSPIALVFVGGAV